MRWTCVIGALLFCSAPGQRAAAAEAPPNILVIISDDQRWTDFGFMGHGAIRTPHLDRLAREGALFPNGYTPTSLCRASLATIVTGLYAHQHRVCCNDPPEGTDRSAMLAFMKSAPALPRLLKEKGYRSLQTGKWWEGHFENGGFTHGMTTKGRHGDEGLVIGRQTMKPVFDFIEAPEGKGRPWFICYAPMMPHLPHNPPERILGRYRKEGRSEADAKYFAMCEWFDETVGELVAYLDRSGLREKTLIVFCVDNGWMNPPPGPRGPQPGRGDPRAKNSAYDAGVRTPVIVNWAGRVKAGRYEDLVSTIDIAPAVLSAAGLKPAREMNGVDLLARAAGGKPLERKAVFGEIYVHTAKDVERPPVNVTHLWVREGKWKLIVTVDGGAAELYDVATDPHERSNLAASRGEVVASLRAKVDAWRGEW